MAAHRAELIQGRMAMGGETVMPAANSMGQEAGGSTHVVTKYGELGYNNSNGASYANRSCVLIVAGGGGGSGYVDGVAPFTHNGKYYPAETEAGVNEGNGKAFIRYVECA